MNNTQELKELTEILCEVEEIREDIMELKFGCELLITEYGEPTLQEYGHNDGDIVKNTYYIGPNEEILGEYGEDIDFDFLKKQISGEEKIDEVIEVKVIGNPLQERHLHIYCKSIGKQCSINNGELIIKGNVVKGFDITKDLHEQKPEVLRDIINFLKGNVGEK